MPAFLRCCFTDSEQCAVSNQLTPLPCHFQSQAAAERAKTLRRTRDQASHRAEELKAHIKVRGCLLLFYM